jgi:hypothetical protein
VRDHVRIARDHPIPAGTDGIAAEAARRQLATHLSYPGIAAELFVSPNTVTELLDG